MHLRETSDKNVSQFWRQTWKEDAGCGKKDIYLHDFHRTCVFSARLEWDLNESTGKGSQGRCVLMIAAPGSHSYKDPFFVQNVESEGFYGSRIACLYIWNSSSAVISFAFSWSEVTSSTIFF